MSTCSITVIWGDGERERKRERKEEKERGLRNLKSRMESEKQKWTKRDRAQKGETERNQGEMRSIV